MRILLAKVKNGSKKLDKKFTEFFIAFCFPKFIDKHFFNGISSSLTCKLMSQFENQILVLLY